MLITINDIEIQRKDFHWNDNLFCNNNNSNIQAIKTNFPVPDMVPQLDIVPTTDKNRVLRNLINAKPKTKIHINLQDTAFEVRKGFMQKSCM